MMTLPQASSYTPTMIKYALQGLEKIYKGGYAYNKAGVMMTGLGSEDHLQPNMFSVEKEGSYSLMSALDRINNRWGRNTMQFAAAGLDKPWGMKRSYKSPAYTTSWHEIPIVTA